MTDQTIEGPAAGTDPSAATSPVKDPASPSMNWQDPFTAIGMLTVALLLVWALYAMGRNVFYDDAFNDGFEAGRASMARDWPYPEQRAVLKQAYSKP